MKRLLTALVGIPVVLAAVWAGSWPFALLVAVAALGAQIEFYRLWSGRMNGSRAAALCATAALCFAPIWPVLLPVSGVFCVAILLSSVAAWHQESSLAETASALAGVLYPGACMASAVALRTSSSTTGAVDAPLALTLTVLVMVWASDSAAYYAGRAFGRHGLSRLSPKKTWEGAVGGAVGALAVALIVWRVWVPAFTALDVALLVFAAAVVAPLGDLAESGLKRSAGVKDSGGLLPGHGGLLDRLDGLMLAMPVVYLYALYAARLVF